MYRANNIQSYFPPFSSQSCFYFAIRITKFVLKQGARTWATCTFVETISICHILLRYWPVSKANAWNSRWVQKLDLLFSISILWFHDFYRATGWKFKDNSNLTHSSISSFSLLPGHSYSYVAPTCYFFVASDYYRNGPNLFLSRTRIIHWYRRMEVRMIFINNDRKSALPDFKFWWAYFKKIAFISTYNIM